MEYFVKDHLGNTRLTLRDANGDRRVERTGDPETEEVLSEHHYYPFGLQWEGNWYDTEDWPKNQYRYNGKELNSDFGLDWYAYGARYYDPGIGRFTGVDPISDRFPWVSTYNYAENEPVGHIDLWGLQKYRPNIQRYEKPSDLLSMKTLNNVKEGVKTVGIELGSLVSNAVTAVVNELRGDGMPPTEEYFDSGKSYEGSGITILSNTDASGNNTLGLPGADEGSTVIIETGEILLPADAGGIVGGAASSSTQATRTMYYSGLALDKTGDLLPEGSKSLPVDSVCNSCNRPPHGNFSYRRLDKNGVPIDTIAPKKENQQK